MKLETLERFLNKSKDIWTLEDVDKLVSRYGKYSVFQETDHIENGKFQLMKHRYMSENDPVISDFLIFKNNDYKYILEFIYSYLDYVDFLFMNAEKNLVILYKILCERIILEKDFKDSENYQYLAQVLNKINTIRFNFVEKLKRAKEEVKGNG